MSRSWSTADGVVIAVSLAKVPVASGEGKGDGVFGTKVGKGGAGEVSGGDVGSRGLQAVTTPPTKTKAASLKNLRLSSSMQVLYQTSPDSLEASFFLKDVLAYAGL